MPRVLNKRTDVVPSDARYVGWPTKWGNPFVIGAVRNKAGEKWTRESSIEAYRLRLETARQMKNPFPLEELRGKDLICWCAPKACHADVLLEIANDPT